MKFAEIAACFRIDKPDKFRLADHDPAECLSFDKDDGKDMLADGAKQLADLQEKLYAQQQWAVLTVLQGMDAAGKDGVIEHVMSGVNPQGCDVHSFKQPSAEELSHDFLWRINRQLPARGRLGIFNRSHYEDVLIVRVHPELLAPQNLPAKLAGKDMWEKRYEDICGFERHLARSGTVVLKFFLHLSREEQRKRFLDRLEQPGKNWKFSMGDVRERALWDKYQAAYEEMIRATSTPEAPWYVVPADRKWFTRLAVASAIVDVMSGLGLAFPKVEGKALADLAEARKALDAEKPAK
jgi:PPK2 family polyphosphate:nucleotide phosphotransferase